jgi:hypothetical protein
MSDNAQDPPIAEPMRQSHSDKSSRPFDAVIGGAVLAATGTFLSTFDVSLGAQMLGFIAIFMGISILLLKAVLPTITPPTTRTARQIRNFTMMFTLVVVLSALSPAPLEADGDGMQMLGLGRDSGAILFGVMLISLIVFFLSTSEVSMHLSGLISAASLLVAVVVNPYTSDVVPCGATSSRPL